jgi:hypothetical protein
MLISTRSPGLKDLSCADKLIKAISVTFGAPSLSGSEYVHEIHNFLQLMHGQYSKGTLSTNVSALLSSSIYPVITVTCGMLVSGSHGASSGNVQKQSLDLHYKQV